MLNQFFYFVLWHKMDNDVLRLLIVFFLGMFWKLVFCKLQNMKWPSNLTSSVFNRGAWSKWLKAPHIYGMHWHNVSKRALVPSKIRLITTSVLLSQLTLLLLVFWSTRSSSLQMFFKKGVLKNVSIFTGKHLYWNFFLIKL